MQTKLDAQKSALSSQTEALKTDIVAGTSEEASLSLRTRQPILSPDGTAQDL